MKIYVEEAPDSAATVVGLVTTTKLGRYEVHFHKSVRKLEEFAHSLEAVVVPIDLGSKYKYGWLPMVLQIRLSLNEKFSRIPVILSGSEDEWEDFIDQEPELSNEALRKIGVELSEPMKVEGVEVQRLQIDSDALKAFVDTKARRPWYTQGRHNQANRWGPYSFLHALTQIEACPVEALASIEDALFEDPFYKKLGKTLRSQRPARQSQEDLRRELGGVRATLSKKTRERRLRILVVEDKLDDGWRVAYEMALQGQETEVEFLWAETREEALEKFSSELDLVILDIRLGHSDENSAGDQYSFDLGQLGGVKLAKKFRARAPFVPIVVATASNKWWMLRELTGHGIDGFWVKESVSEEPRLDHSLMSVADFCRQVGEVLDWSLLVRPWLEGMQGVADRLEPAAKGWLDDKARSLRALLVRSFTPYSAELAKGLQYNLAFLVVYSSINDVVTAMTTVEKDPNAGDDIWAIRGAGSEGRLVTRRRHEPPGSKPGYQYMVHRRDGEGGWVWNFDEGEVFRELLRRYCSRGHSRRFKDLRRIRNQLPLVHGKADEQAYTETRDVGRMVEPEKVSELVAIIGDLVDSWSIAGQGDQRRGGNR